MTATDAGEPRSCVMCGYDLRGLADARCPECGVAFDPTALPAAEVPWLRRREIGRVRAYCQTVLFVVAQPRRFARQASRYATADAQAGESFRRVTVTVAAVSVALIAGTLTITGDATLLEIARDAAMIGALALPPAAAFFWIATLRVPVRFHDGRTPQAQERFRRLQNFCCAGLGLFPLATVVTAAAAFAAATTTAGSPPVVLTVASIVIVFAAWCGGCAMFLLLAAPVRASNALAAVVGSAGLWCIALFGALVTWYATLAVAQLIFG